MRKKKSIICPCCTGQVEMREVGEETGRYRAGRVRDKSFECPQCGCLEEASINIVTRELEKVINIKKPI